MKWLINIIRQSLFLRLFAIFALTLFLLISIVSTSSYYISSYTLDDHGPTNFFSRHIDMLVDDIGTPPDLDKAADLAEQLQVAIHITGPDIEWSSEESATDIERLRNTYAISDNLTMVRYRSARGLRLSKNDFNFYLLFQNQIFTADQRLVAYIAIAASIGVFIFNYWLVHRLLRPIRLLQLGAERISSGELDHRVKHDRQDELGNLTNSINHMADSLQSMLDAKQQLLLAVSHELRTPITRAKLQLEMLDSEEAQQSLRDDINELDLLVTELLEAERLNSQHAKLNLETLSLAHLVKDMINQYWPEHQQIQLQLSTDDRQLPIDRLRFSLLLRNLINNALRYGNNKPITVSVSFNDHEAIVRVEDQGQGIEQEHIPYLTEPFYRADDARQRQTGGFGVGLYLCRLIAEAHEGKLTITSKLDIGTQVSVVFPM